VHGSEQLSAQQRWIAPPLACLLPPSRGPSTLWNNPGAKKVIDLPMI
jgi:hypothetical protein